MTAVRCHVLQLEFVDLVWVGVGSTEMPPVVPACKIVDSGQVVAEFERVCPVRYLLAGIAIVGKGRWDKSGILREVAPKRVSGILILV